MNVGLELFVNYDPQEVESILVLVTDGRDLWQKSELTLSRHQGFLLFSNPSTKRVERLFVLSSPNDTHKICKEMYLKRRACLRVTNNTEQVFIRFSSTKLRKQWYELINEGNSNLNKSNWKQSIIDLSSTTGSAIRSLSDSLNRQKRRITENQNALVTMIKKLRI